MNRGLKIFKRLQGGTGDVRYTPVTPTSQYPYSTDYEFIHAPDPSNYVTPSESYRMTGGATANDEFQNAQRNMGYGPAPGSPQYYETPGMQGDYSTAAYGGDDTVYGYPTVRVPGYPPSGTRMSQVSPNYEFRNQLNEQANDLDRRYVDRIISDEDAGLLSGQPRTQNPPRDTGLGGWGQPSGYFGVPDPMEHGYYGAPSTIGDGQGGLGTVAGGGTVNAPHWAQTEIGFGGNLGGSAPANLSSLHQTPWYIQGQRLTPEEHGWLGAGGVRSGYGGPGMFQNPASTLPMWNGGQNYYQAQAMGAPQTREQIATSGQQSRHTPQRLTAQHGVSDVNPLAIFRRFQEGTGDVRYTPVTPTKEYPYSTDYEFLHRKDVPLEEQEQEHDDLTPEVVGQLTPEEEAQEQQDWDQNIKEVLAYTPNLTPEERQQVLTLNPKDWDDSTREKVGQASEQAGKAIQLQQGTSNVGLRLFRRQLQKPRKQKL